MVNDKVGDFIVRLKNAGMVGKREVVTPYSKLRHAIATKLKDTGYVTDVATEGTTPVEKRLIITLAGTDASHRINGVKRISKPGRRLYAKVAEIHPVKFGKGHMILSTPAGILTDTEARERKVGGEQLFIIW